MKDSDGSGSDTENEGRNKHGRKNIRKVMYLKLNHNIPTNSTKLIEGIQF